MQRLPSINPGDTSKYANGIGTFDIGAADEGSKILLKNFSPLNLDLDFLNGSTDMLHAWEANYWTLDGDTPQIEWEVDADSLNVSAPPISAVFMTLYAPQEKISGTYPVYFGLQTSIGNQGGLPSSVSQLQNTGNPSGTNVISVGSAAAAGTTWTASNDGLWTLAVTIAAALVQVLKTNETDPILQLGQAAHQVEVLGDLTVDNQLSTKLCSIFGAAPGITDLYTDRKASINGLGGETSSVGGHLQIAGNLFELGTIFGNNLNTITVKENTNGNTAIDLSTGNGTVKFPQSIIANGGMNINTIRDNVNGNAALDLSAGTGVVKFNLPIRIVPKVVSINGSTSGSFTIYEFCIGAGATDLKLCVCVSNNFRNGGGSVQSLALPSAFQSFVRMWHGEISPATITNGGVTQNVGTITGLPASNANTGAVSVGPTIAAYTIDDTAGGFDTINFNSGQATAHTGVSVWLGI